jgi:hypothetical protein
MMATAMAALVSGRAMAADHRHHQPASADSTTATVENDLDHPVVVYLEAAGREVRLGTVSPESDSTFTLPRWIVTVTGQEVDFFVHPAKGFDQDTGMLDLRRGEHLGIEVRHG